MSKVERVVIADGDFHEVAAAVRADGSVPFIDLLTQLEQGMWQDPLVEEYPDEYQPKMRSRVLAEIEHLADYGEPARDYDYLTEGIWEFKIGNLRVTFYDTPGDGTFTPRLGERNEGHWVRHRRQFPEDCDEFVRVGHCFVKTSQKTRQTDLGEAKRVREEDLKYDIA